VAPDLPPGYIPPARFIVTRLVLDPIRTGRIWAATSYGLLRSEDGGISWRSILMGADGVLTVAVDPRSPSTILASDYQTVSRSADGGDTWTITLYEHLVRALVFDAANPGVVYAGASSAYLGFGVTDPGAIYQSTDSGTTWTEPDPSFQPSYVWGLDIDPTDAGALLAATIVGIYRSADHGRSWKQVYGPGVSATDVAVGAGDNGIFASTASNGYFDETTVGTVLRSSDGGSHFEPSFTGFGLKSIAIDPLAPFNVYAGGSDGVVHSQDGGITWTLLNEGLSGKLVTTLAIEPRTGSVLAGTYQAGVFKLPLQRGRVSECRSPRAVAPRP